MKIRPKLKKTREGTKITLSIDGEQDVHHAIVEAKPHEELGVSYVAHVFCVNELLKEDPCDDFEKCKVRTISALVFLALDKRRRGHEKIPVA